MGCAEQHGDRCRVLHMRFGFESVLAGTSSTSFAAMTTDDHVQLRAEVLWLAVRKTSVGGRSCREYEVLDERGAILLAARAFVWGREITITDPEGRAVFAVVRSRAFPLTGKATVTELPSNSPLGTVLRNGTYRSASGADRGRFVDARSMRERTRESLFQGAMDAILTSGADAAVPSGPDSFVLEIDGAVGGTLSHGRLPFTVNQDAASADSGKLTDRLPQFLRGAWRSLNAPRGWKLVRTRAPTGDPRLQLGAAIFAVELSRW